MNEGSSKDGRKMIEAFLPKVRRRYALDTAEVWSRPEDYYTMIGAAMMDSKAKIFLLFGLGTIICMHTQL